MCCTFLRLPFYLLPDLPTHWIRFILFEYKAKMFHSRNAILKRKLPSIAAFVFVFNFPQSSHKISFLIPWRLHYFAKYIIIYIRVHLHVNNLLFWSVFCLPVVTNSPYSTAPFVSIFMNRKIKFQLLENMANISRWNQFLLHSENLQNSMSRNLSQFGCK